MLGRQLRRAVDRLVCCADREDRGARLLVRRYLLAVVLARFIFDVVQVMRLVQRVLLVGQREVHAHDGRASLRFFEELV